MKTIETELFQTVLKAMHGVESVEIEDPINTKSALFLLRLKWERIEEALRDSKTHGFLPVIEAMNNLTSAMLTMTAALQAKLHNQENMFKEEEEAEVELKAFDKTRLKQVKDVIAKLNVKENKPKRTRRKWGSKAERVKKEKRANT